MKNENEHEISNFYLKTSKESEDIEIIEGIEFTNEFKQNVCIPYFRDIYKDLNSRSFSDSKGISKVVFLEFTKIPGLIGERLFNVFDILKDNFIDQTEFVTNLFKVFSSNFNIRIKFIFDMYDFDKNGFISKEDVRTLLSSMPIEFINVQDKIKTNVKEGILTQNGEGKEQFNDRAEIQAQLNKVTELCFKEKENLSFSDFKMICENISSEMFICLYMMIRKSFADVLQFSRYENKKEINYTEKYSSPKSPIKVLASPKVIKKFSSSLISLKLEENVSNESEESIEKNDIQINSSPKHVFNFQNYSIYTNNQINPYKDKSKKSPVTNPESQLLAKEKKDSEQNLDMEEESIRLVNTKIKDKDIVESPSAKIMGITTNNLFCSCGNIINDLNILKCDDCIMASKIGIFEGEMYKIKKGSAPKLFWYVLEKRELHRYTNKDQKNHISMHYLNGCFVEEIEHPENFENLTLYTFSLHWRKLEKKFGVKSKNERDTWITIIKKLICYANINDFYILGHIIGKGKFSKVKIAQHRRSGQDVAVKIVKKSLMNTEDIELQYREIEILKLCQHPNIIRLLDVFESKKNIYLILEHLKGGDLFGYLEERKFKLKEDHASKIIHSISTALFYIHSFGIVHRDLKPENILMSDNSDKAEPKIVDFGLSKMIGPNEKCIEPYGTLTYVSPELLDHKEYGKAVDIWSLGVIAYLMLSGYLPFEAESGQEIMRLTINQQPDFFNQPWDQMSYASIDFVKKCLTKDPNKRITLTEILQHPWIIKENKKIKTLRKQSNDKFRAFSLPLENYNEPIVEASKSQI